MDTTPVCSSLFSRQAKPSANKPMTVLSEMKGGDLVEEAMDVALRDKLFRQNAGH